MRSHTVWVRDELSNSYDLSTVSYKYSKINRRETGLKIWHKYMYRHIYVSTPAITTGTSTSPYVTSLFTNGVVNTPKNWRIKHVLSKVQLSVKGVGKRLKSLSQWKSNIVYVRISTLRVPTGCLCRRTAIIIYDLSTTVCNNLPRST